jgi:transposase
MRARWSGWRCRAAASAVTRRPRRSPALRREAPVLEQELAKARFVVDVQAKLHALLETLCESADTEPRSTP